MSLLTYNCSRCVAIQYSLFYDYIVPDYSGNNLLYFYFYSIPNQDLDHDQTGIQH